MTDEEKVQGLVGRTIVWSDLDDNFLHLETEDGFMFHIRVDIDEDYSSVEINADLSN